MTIFVIVFTLVLWLGFIAIMGIVDDAKDREDLSFWQKVGVVLFVLLLDVPHNYTAAVILFLGLPPGKGNHTLTERMRFYLHTTQYYRTWRWYLSRFICRYMVEPWDKGHCRLERLK